MQYLSNIIVLKPLYGCIGVWSSKSFIFFFLIEAPEKDKVSI